MEFIKPSNDEIYDMSLKLADKIIESGYKPDLIIAIARGGFTPARLVADFLEHQKLTSFEIKYYEAFEGRVGEKHGGKPHVEFPLNLDLKGKKVLIVDDVADSGKSLVSAVEHIEEFNPMEIRTAVLYVKPTSIFTPDHHVAETSAWIIFPWERYEIFVQLTRDGVDLKKAGYTDEEIEYFDKIRKGNLRNKGGG
jgi:hypoxanthine phosphoribosyltransferase